ncbi:MAG: hypothetical protein WA705_31310 [Candidatus Ozemobacteraceae bacterium]
MEKFIRELSDMVEKKMYKKAVEALRTYRRNTSNEEMWHVQTQVSSSNNAGMLSEVVICEGNEYDYSLSDESRKRIVFDYFSTWEKLDPEEANSLFWKKIVPDFRFSTVVVFLIELYVKNTLFKLQQIENRSILKELELAWLTLDKYGLQDIIHAGITRASIIQYYIQLKKYDFAKKLLVQVREPIDDDWMLYYPIAKNVNDVNFIKSALHKMRSFRDLISDQVYKANFRVKIIEFFAHSVDTIETRVKEAKELGNFSKEIIETINHILANHKTLGNDEIKNALLKYYEFEDSLHSLCDVSQYNSAKEFLGECSLAMRTLTPENQQALNSMITSLEELEFQLQIDLFEKKYKLLTERINISAFSPSQEIKLDSILRSEAMSMVKAIPKAVNLLVSGESLWKVVEDQLDKFTELTFAVCNYLKAVEIILHEQIKTICSGEIIRVFGNGGLCEVKVGSDEYKRATLGNYIHFIKFNSNLILKNPGKGRYLFNLLIDWSDNVRNAHFHQDLITEIDDALRIREKTLTVINEIGDLFRCH